MTDLQLSDHFHLSDVTRSSTASRKGIDNSLELGLLPAAYKTAVGLEKVQAILGVPVSVTSWYRSLRLNRAIGSSDTSQHVKCEAVDFTASQFGTPAEICKYLIKNQDLIRWDQLILEHTWVHISWDSIPNGVQRGEVLSLLESGKYSHSLTDSKGVPV